MIDKYENQDVRNKKEPPSRRRYFAGSPGFVVGLTAVAIALGAGAILYQSSVDPTSVVTRVRPSARMPAETDKAPASAQTQTAQPRDQMPDGMDADAVVKAVERKAQDLRAFGYEQKDKLQNLSDDVSAQIEQFVAAVDRNGERVKRFGEKRWERSKQEIEARKRKASEALEALQKTSQDAWADGRDQAANQLERLAEAIRVGDEGETLTN